MAVAFVILTAGRAGSSFLTGALRSHPATLCFGEVLEEPDQDSLGHREVMLRAIQPGEGVTDYCRDVVFRAGSRQCAAVGFKLKYYHLEGNRLARYLLDARVSIIHLKRTNLIAQSLSLALAENHDFADYLDDPAHVGRYHRPTAVDVGKVIARAEYNQHWMRQLDRRFRPGGRLLETRYETLCRSDESGTLTAQDEVDRILGFLGLESCRLRCDFARQRLAPYSELIENFDDVRAAILAAHPEWEEHVEALDAPGRLV